jgi:hypothetical protein
MRLAIFLRNRPGKDLQFPARLGKRGRVTVEFPLCVHPFFDAKGRCMPAWKALLTVVILGAIVALGVFLFFPKMRPPFVKEWFFKAQGYSLAKNPTDAITKFQEAIQARNYEAAQRYLAGDYADEFRRGAEGGQELAKAIDDLTHNVEKVAKINSDRGKVALQLLDPWPKDWRFKLEHKEGEDEATAIIAIDLITPDALKNRDLSFNTAWKLDRRIMMSLVPVEAYTYAGLPVKLKSEGTKEKVWKLYFPTSDGLHASVAYLKENYGNYAGALNSVKWSVKNDPTVYTKDGFETALRTELDKAGKP